MTEAHRAHERELMVEAFRAGWQAALAVRVTHPRVLAVIDSCFELWLEEAADEVVVLGLPFRRRDDLPAHPAPVRRRTTARKPTAAPDPAGPPGTPAAAFTALGTGSRTGLGAGLGAGLRPGRTQPAG